MNWDRVEGNWKEFQGKVQQKWGKLTNDDMNVVAGKRTELSARGSPAPAVLGQWERTFSICNIRGDD